MTVWTPAIEAVHGVAGGHRRGGAARPHTMILPVGSPTHRGFSVMATLRNTLEPISQMAKQDHGARQVQEAEEVSAPALIAGDEAPRVLEPGEETLDAPAAAVAPQRATVLGPVDAIASVRSDELDVDRRERAVERVAVVGGVPDQSGRVVGEKTGV
ncbi:MAG: hypothetical protein FD124_3828 [Alphaproteobacteria bacterium]|nr:MAG: hypothetical protein FD124_3828 [Alphaproteobacteria bacterium]